MTLYPPRSTLTLILFAFAVVVLPLFVALGYAGVYVDRLAGQAQDAVHDAARAIQGSRGLTEGLTVMERAARQYLVLDDPAVLDVYLNAHREFRGLLERLQSLATSPEQRAALATLGREEREVFRAITAGDPWRRPDQQAVAGQFTTLNRLSEEVRLEANRQIERNVQFMQRNSRRAQELMIWLAAALVPLTLLSTGVFAVLISRPVRQLDRAIRRLGDEHFDTPIRVSGPDDLRALAARLDWLRQRLLDLEEQKTKFLRHISHELKTPLTSIRESSDLLGDEVVGPLNAEQREITQILAESGRQLQALIENLLDFSRTQLRRPALELSRVSVSALIETVIQTHKPAILAKELAADVRLFDCDLFGDREKLRTVLDNLLSNAIKFSPHGGVLEVRAYQTSKLAVVEIADEGPGVPEAERAKIFDAFYQGQGQPGSYVKGSGLGLSIAQEYTLAHNGRIEVLDGDRQGAYFRVLLPRKPQNAPGDPTVTLGA